MISWQGETMLLQWAESSTRGRTITLLLPEDEDTHPFRDFTIKSGKRAGQRFMCVFVQIGDDEAPVAQPVSTESVLLCRRKDFWDWASAQQWEAVISEESARDWLCKKLGIESRSELNSNEHAATRFRLLVAQFKKDIGELI
jgi:hypothetical protein